MLLDEAHALKNANSQRSRRLRKLASGCRGRVMLTGTPLQNDLGELHNLLSFLLPQLFKEAEESAEGGFGEWPRLMNFLDDLPGKGRERERQLGSVQHLGTVG